MADKEMLLYLIRRQQTMLNRLIDEFSRKESLEAKDYDLYDRISLEVERNLRSLRRSTSGNR